MRLIGTHHGDCKFIEYLVVHEGVTKSTAKSFLDFIKMADDLIPGSCDDLEIEIINKMSKIKK